MSTHSVLCTPIQDNQPLPVSAGWKNLISQKSQKHLDFQAKGFTLRYLSEGKEKFRMAGLSYQIEAGQFVLLNPGQVHYSVEQPSSGVWAEISLADLAPLLKEIRRNQPEKYKLLRADKNESLQLFDHVYSVDNSQLGLLLKSWSESDTRKTEKIRELFGALLEHQMEVFEKINRLTSAKLSTRMELYRRLCQAQDYIHQNLESPLDLDTLSQVACLSKYHFIRLFKEVYEETPRQYLIKQRLDRAKNLLVGSKKTFHEICHEVGLKDSSSFGRLFKRSFGSTPQIYRQMNAVG
jgi:AraC family transcriptional regulator